MIYNFLLFVVISLTESFISENMWQKNHKVVATVELPAPANHFSYFDSGFWNKKSVSFPPQWLLESGLNISGRGCKICTNIYGQLVSQGAYLELVNFFHTPLSPQDFGAVSWLLMMKEQVSGHQRWSPDWIYGWQSRILSYIFHSRHFTWYYVKTSENISRIVVLFQIVRNFI